MSDLKVVVDKESKQSSSPVQKTVKGEKGDSGEPGLRGQPGSDVSIIKSILESHKSLIKISSSGQGPPQ